MIKHTRLTHHNRLAFSPYIRFFFTEKSLYQGIWLLPPPLTSFLIYWIFIQLSTNSTITISADEGQQGCIPSFFFLNVWISGHHHPLLVFFFSHGKVAVGIDLEDRFDLYCLPGGVRSFQPVQPSSTTITKGERRGDKKTRRTSRKLFFF